MSDPYCDGFADGRGAFDLYPPYWAGSAAVRDYERGYHDGVWEDE